MRVTAIPLTIPVVVGLVMALTAASVAADHLSKPESEKPQPQQPPTTVKQEPQPRQNFRARRPDEIPPWEGYEDCPMMFPCVGAVGPDGWQN
jgi:hypothetical protein